MTTKQDVVNHIISDKFYDDVLVKYLRKKEERDEFRQELWLIILQMPEEKLISYYDMKCLKYVYIGIINNQIKSNTSPWHRKFRGIVVEYEEHKEVMRRGPSCTYRLMGNDIDDHEAVLVIKKNFELKIRYIESKLIELERKDPRLYRDISVFKLHFYEGLTYRAIALKTNICLVSVWKYVNNVIFLLQKDKNNIKLV